MGDATTSAAGILRFGHSPDPDDAFMFFGLARGAVRIRDFRVEHALHDIQTLNEMAMSGAIEITAISAHAYPSVADRYWIMRCGASMGIGYGPILVVRPEGPSSKARRLLPVAVTSRVMIRFGCFQRLARRRRIRCALK